MSCFIVSLSQRSTWLPVVALRSLLTHAHARVVAGAQDLWSDRPANQRTNHHDVTFEHIHRKESTYGGKAAKAMQIKSTLQSEPENSRMEVLGILARAAMPKFHHEGHDVLGLKFESCMVPTRASFMHFPSICLS